MNSINFEGANTTLGENQKGVLPIRAFRGMTLQNTPLVVTCWKPSDEERVRIAAGEPVYIMLQTLQPPPQCVVVDSPFVEPVVRRRPELDRHRKVKRFSDALGMYVEDVETEFAWEETATGLIKYYD